MTEFGQTMIDAITLGSMYALLALGLALVFGVMGLVNFAYGELLMIGAYCVYLVAGLPALLVIAITLAVTTVASVALERVAFRPVRNASPATMLVTSFALGVLLQNLALVIFGGRAKSPGFGDSLNTGVEVGPLLIPKFDFVTIAVTIAMMAAIAGFLSRSRLGLQMRAAALDFNMSRALGVRADNVIAGAFALSGFIAGAAALLLVAYTGNVTPQMGSQPVLIAFVAVVIGGMSKLPRAVAGGFLVGALATFLQAWLPASARPFRDTLLFTVVILILLIRPHGLFGRAQAARV